ETLNISLGAGDDQFQIPSVGNVTNMNAGAGADAIRVGSAFVYGSRGSKAAGTVNDIQALLTIDGQGGADSLFVDDTGDATANEGKLTSTRITGLGMHLVGTDHDVLDNQAFGITYLSFQNLTIGLGSSADIFTVVSTHAGNTTI